MAVVARVYVPVAVVRVDLPVVRVDGSVSSLRPSCLDDMSRSVDVRLVFWVYTLPTLPYCNAVQICGRAAPTGKGNSKAGGGAGKRPRATCTPTLCVFRATPPQKYLRPHQASGAALGAVADWERAPFPRSDMHHHHPPPSWSCWFHAPSRFGRREITAPAARASQPPAPRRCRRRNG